MNIIVLVVFLIASVAGFWYYSKNKEKVKGWFSKSNTATATTADVYVAKLSEDCTGLTEDPLTEGAVLEIHVNSSEQMSIHGIVKGKGSLQSMSDPNKEQALSDVQSGVFVNSGCIKYTSEGDEIKLNFDGSDISKWMGDAGDTTKLVFKRDGKDTIVGTNTVDGSVCKFKKSTTKTAPKECEKPSVGCSMM